MKADLEEAEVESCAKVRIHCAGQDHLCIVAGSHTLDG